MPRYSPEDIKRSNRTLLYILILLVGIIVAFIVAIATSSNDATIIVTQEVNNLKRLQAQQELEDTSQVGNSQDSINNAEVVKKEVKPENEPVVTKKEVKIEEKPTKVASPSLPDGQVAYTHSIGSGDNLSVLSRRFHVTITTLKDFNKLESEVLQAGKTLQIPVTALHTVANGETLTLLATKYKVKPELIKKANKLPSDNVALDVKLVIPLP